MNSKERAALRAAANPLEPIFQIGKEGISENLISQLDDALDARERSKYGFILKPPRKNRANWRMSCSLCSARRSFRSSAA